MNLFVNRWNYDVTEGLYFIYIVFEFLLLERGGFFVSEIFTSRDHES